ncbi:hypothetical protein Tco_0147947 [Tanacetum coccineum]
MTRQSNYMQLLKWKLHENCGVHTLSMDGTPMEINMLVEKKYPLIKELLEKMLNLQLEAEEESTMGRIVGNSELLLPVILYYCWFKIDTAAKD